MRDVFPEWYAPTDDELQMIYQTAIVIPDANVLLSVYRADSEADGHRIIDAFQACAERLWVPYQVAHEYHKNRLGVISRQDAFYDKICAAWDRLQESLQTATKEAPKGLRDKVDREFRGARGRFDRALQKIRAQKVVTRDSAVSSDPFRDRWDVLLRGRVGQLPSVELLLTRHEEARRRADQHIPPGYEDSTKSEDRAAGDYLIWCEILDRAQNSDHPILFVTNEQKEDWCLKVAGRTIGPRPELVREVRERSQQTYCQHTLESFLYHTSRYFDTATVSEETLERVAHVTENIGIRDEVTAKLLSPLVEDPRSGKALGDPARQWPGAEAIARALGDPLRNANTEAIARALGDPMRRWSAEVIAQALGDPMRRRSAEVIDKALGAAPRVEGEIEEPGGTTQSDEEDTDGPPTS